MSTVNNYIYYTIYNKLQIKLIFCNILHDSVIAIAHTIMLIFIYKNDKEIPNICANIQYKKCVLQILYLYVITLIYHLKKNIDSILLSNKENKNKLFI